MLIILAATVLAVLTIAIAVGFAAFLAKVFK